MVTKKKSGIITDPWRFRNPPPEPEPEAPAPNPKAKDDSFIPNKGDYEDDTQAQTKSVEYPNYGGITITGVTHPEAIASAVLQFCVDHHREIDPVLVEYGILLAKLHPGKLDLVFFIARADGWTLTIPDAENRLQGLLALIQCLLTLDERPPLKAAMRTLGIQPYRL